MSVEEYHRQPERNANGRQTELIRGIVVEKMPKSPLHGTIASLLFKVIEARLPAGFCARKEEALTLSDSEPQPDISILTGRLEDYLHRHPSTALLAVEVSISTYPEDQQKAFLYAEASVDEYWIVLPASRTVEVYRRPESGRYCEMRVYRAGEALACASVPGVEVDLTALFAGIEGGTVAR